MTAPEERSVGDGSPVFVYVMAPLTQGDVAMNIKAAIDAANELREMGYVPFVPHLSFYWHTIHPRPYEDWMAMDFSWIGLCHFGVRLPGYSPGADREEVEFERQGKAVVHGVEALRRFRQHGLTPLGDGVGA